MGMATQGPYNGRTMSLNSLWEALSGRGADQDKPADRRSEMRLPAEGALMVRRQVEGAEAEAVSLVGISEHGFSFRSASQLSPAEKILVEVNNEKFEAVARHCTSAGDGYIVGAEILPRRPPGDAESQAADELL